MTVAAVRSDVRRLVSQHMGSGQFSPGHVPFGRAPRSCSPGHVPPDMFPETCCPRTLSPRHVPQDMFPRTCSPARTILPPFLHGVVHFPPTTTTMSQNDLPLACTKLKFPASWVGYGQDPRCQSFRLGLEPGPHVVSRLGSGMQVSASFQLRYRFILIGAWWWWWGGMSYTM